ncbi:MAG: aminotransferase class V-fold PLP-dependent enzyme [Pseudomonadota bacterium]
MESIFETEFELDEDLIYLNHAAVSPWPRRTRDAVQRFAAENAQRGSLGYPRWLETEQRLREQLQQLLNAPSSDDIALVKNTSEALSFVAAGLDWSAGDNIVTSDQEFPSNRIVWEALADQGVELRQVDLHAAATPEESLFARVDERTRLIAISSVQYASGLRMELPTIGRFCREHEVLFCVDAIQELGARPFDVQACGADFVAADGHKWMLGPEGLGLFYVRAALRPQLKLTQFGWHMVDKVGDFDAPHWRAASSARRFECGSPNMLGVHALSASLSLLLECGMEQVAGRLHDHMRFLSDALSQRGMLVCPPAALARRAGIISFSHPDGSAATEQLQQQLEKNGVFCALRGGNIRLSPHFYTPRAHLTRTLALIDSV